MLPLDPDLSLAEIHSSAHVPGQHTGARGTDSTHSPLNLNVQVETYPGYFFQPVNYVRSE